MWFLDRIGGGSTYNEFIAFRIDGPLDTVALGRALCELVRRHEALRTTFPEIDGAPVQTIAAEVSFAPEIIDLEGVGALAIEDELAARLDAEARRPFDLVNGPLFRAILLRVTHSRHVLMLSLHHIICDRWSADVLARELTAIFAAYTVGGEFITRSSPSVRRLRGLAARPDRLRRHRSPDGLLA